MEAALETVLEVHMIDLVMRNGIILTFWLERAVDGRTITCWVRKRDDRRPTPEKYKVYSVSSAGEFWRHSGLPSGWGMRLTVDRRIKEVR
jgi:hypothetical protein